MTDSEPTGIPYDGTGRDELDQWSRDIFDALDDWRLAQEGAWTCWDPGYLLLKVTSVGGEIIEPIMIDTADEELTVNFGYWETHLPEPGAASTNAREAAGQAKQLIEDWLSGRLRSAVLVDEAGKWCGSFLIEPGELLPQLKYAVQRVRDFNPVQVEIRTPIRHNWTTYPVEPDWLTPPPPSELSTGRLPK